MVFTICSMTPTELEIEGILSALFFIKTPFMIAALCPYCNLLCNFKVNIGKHFLVD